MNPSRITPISSLSSQPKSTRNPLWEAFFDTIISILTLLALAPVILFISLFIKVVSSGPTLFKQRRIGYKGQSFMIYKFRTMHVNASTSSHEDHTSNLIKSKLPMVKMDAKGDNRIIPLGRFLRASGIDELPQLINVLKGEMSITGPRPCLPTEYAEYSSHEEKRFETLPGLTGLWQVSGKNRLTFDQMIDCDIRYARQKSAWMYLAIVFKTPFVLIQQVIESRKLATISQMPSEPIARFEKKAAGQ